MGATLTPIPEEFERPIRLKTLADTLVGAIIKRMNDGRRDGVAAIAERAVLDIDPNDLAALETAERDAHGHVRIAEVNIGEILKLAVEARLREFGVKSTIVAKNVGYELRCAYPVAYDMEYLRDLRYCAAKYLLQGGNGAVVTMQAGRFVPVPFDELVDPATGRTAVRPDRGSRRAIRSPVVTMIGCAVTTSTIRTSSPSSPPHSDSRSRTSASSSSTSIKDEPKQLVLEGMPVGESVFKNPRAWGVA